MAPKFGENVAWHPACFQCTTCAELLVDLTYCVHEEQLYCERHYAEQLKPRCSACDEVSLISYPFQPLDGLTLHTIGSSIARNLKTKTKTGIFSWHESHARFSTTQFIRLLLFCLFVTGSPSRRRFPPPGMDFFIFSLIVAIVFPHSNRTLSVEWTRFMAGWGSKCTDASVERRPEISPTPSLSAIICAGGLEET